MLHAPLFGRSVPSRPTITGDHPPFTPAAYVRIRRTAAKLTVDQAAERIGKTQAELSEARALIRMLETPGNVARHPATLRVLQAAFPFDANVYRQLATEPADRHPRICRGCGCSEWDPCVHEHRGACAWAGPAVEICTGCTEGKLL